MAHTDTTPPPDVAAPRAALARRASGAAGAPAGPAKGAYRKVSAGRYRFIRAYWTTFARVIASYLWLSFKARLWGKSYKERHLADVHKRNAKRVESTILVLQGLFIKVGQLLSILADFLPEEFRSELEGLQDQVPPRPYAEESPCESSRTSVARCRSATPSSTRSPSRAPASARCTAR